MTNYDEILATLPDVPTHGPWVFFQEWKQLSYLHFPVSADEVRPLVPKDIEIDTYQGSAYVSIVLFVADKMHIRALPSIPGFSTWSQINVRTYIRVGEEKGVYFFNTYCDSAIASWMGQHIGHLNLYDASVAITQEAETTIAALRREKEPGAAVFSARVTPTGETFEAAPGSLDSFVLVRDNYFSESDGVITRMDLRHPPYSLKRAEVDIFESTVAAACGIRVADRPLLAHQVMGATPVFSWLPVKLPASASKASSGEGS